MPLQWQLFVTATAIFLLFTISTALCRNNLPKTLEMHSARKLCRFVIPFLSAYKYHMAWLSQNTYPVPYNIKSFCLFTAYPYLIILIMPLSSITGFSQKMVRWSWWLLHPETVIASPTHVAYATLAYYMKQDSRSFSRLVNKKK